MPTFVCPHCCLSMGASEDASHPPQAMRCDSCRLVVGVGRATLASSRGTTSGSAAGTLANAARRADESPVELELAIADLHAAATSLGCDVQRLRMLDYEAAWRLGEVATSLGQMLATFRSWKAARDAALKSGPVEDAGILAERYG